MVDSDNYDQEKHVNESIIDFDEIQAEPLNECDDQENR